MGFKCPDTGKLTNPTFIVAPFLVAQMSRSTAFVQANDSRLMFSEKVVRCDENNAEPALFHGVQMKGHIPPAATIRAHRGMMKSTKTGMLRGGSTCYRNVVQEAAAETLHLREAHFS
jgi:hypothetical protein